MTLAAKRDDTDDKRQYVVEVDGVAHTFAQERVTAVEIMAAANIPVATGLLELLEDGTQRQVDPAETFELEKAPRFRKRPRFKRGAR